MTTKDALKLFAIAASRAVEDTMTGRKRGPSRYISDELHHMVGFRHPDDDELNYELLKVILGSGWISAAPPRKGWGPIEYGIANAGKLVDETYVVPKVTCYCDIPVEALGIHIAKYGRFGISFARWELARRGARPVTYVPLRSDDYLGALTGSAVLADIEAAHRGLVEHLAPTVDPNFSRRGVGVRPMNASEAVHTLSSVLGLHVLSFIKPFNALIEDRERHYYYAEREWRMLGGNEASPATVTRIIVARGFMRRARQDLPAFADRIVFAPNGPGGRRARLRASAARQSASSTT